jgi:hypothetical protein
MTTITYRGFDIYRTEGIVRAHSRWTWARQEWDLGAPIGYAATVEEAKELIDDELEEPPNCDFCDRPGEVFGGYYHTGWLCSTCETRLESGQSIEDICLVPIGGSE